MAIRGARKPSPWAAGRHALWCALEALESRRLLSTTVIANPATMGAISGPVLAGYTPTQVLNAYGFNSVAQSIGATGGDGSGQTIAIVEAYRDTNLGADVHAFDQEFSLP